ncbi:PP2C family protein-serine/threonine phosphatase [Streptomyces millisiae]|uniref:PP2C family protein-serine/threonine phosphatase n=1 Tax=Streptomyces millisiae TaxID=3075542 RepID=A0ABU2LS57_9ACTN|nr:PP2C family protein-serine/threonine phosphatase [Streptomyces sp. DSM 44918]MDT0320436.1 PP2C family protein-serine/threonine phosphatase [Streptomyces sp. DSM 44918]
MTLPLPGPLPGAGPAQVLPRWLRLLPAALLIGTAVAQLAEPRSQQFGYLLSALPPLTGLIYGPGLTAVLGAAVLVLLALPVTRPGHVSGGDLAAVAAIGAFSVLVAWFRARYTRDLVVFGSVAEAAQRAVLPPLPEHVGPVHCAGLYRAAQRGALVGGDLYDVRAGPFGVRALVGDVQGHGVAAVGTVAAILGAFREAALDEAGLEGVAARLDRRLRLDAGDRTELFATALLLEFPPGGAVVRLVSCGHPPPLLLRGGRVRELDSPPGPPLGLGLPDGGAPRLAATDLASDDVLLGYTDGVTEARGAGGAFYPLVDRLTARLGADGALAPGDVVDFVWRDLTAFAGEIRDDVALLGLSLNAQPHADAGLDTDVDADPATDGGLNYTHGHSA